MSIHYDQYLTQHFRHIAEPGTLRWNALAAIDHHGRYFPADKNAAILEIGPGFGALLEQLQTRCGYRNVTGVDVSPEVVNTCNRISPGSTTLADNTAEFLSERPGTFDLVLMMHVLEHVPRENMAPLLNAVKTSLKDGGKLIVEVPNIAHPVMGPYNRYHDFTHTVGFTDQSLAFVLRNAGFRDVEIYGCRMPRKNPVRLIQRTAQDIVELLAAVRLRLFLPRQKVNLAVALGACAAK